MSHRGAADAMVHFNLAEAIVKDALLGKNKLDSQCLSYFHCA
jgi:hypothetical protein